MYSMMMEVDSSAVLAVCIGRMPKAELNKYLSNFGIGLRNYSSIIGAGSVDDLLKGIGSFERKSAERDLEKWARLGIRWCTVESPHFPDQVSKLSDPPVILFYRGSSPAAATLERSVSIVGSRKASAWSCDFAVQVGFQVASHGGVVVSGLALGIDGAAHRGAVKAIIEHGDRGGQTIAILGNGLSSIYPAAHRGLAYGILDRGGVLISQFEPGCSPLPHQFLMRNQLIAGYSTTTVVIAAARRSGALNTARCALDLGREVVAVPGALQDSGMAGCNLLLQDGAHMLLGASEILPFFAARFLDEVGDSERRPSAELHSISRVPQTLKDRVLALVLSEGTVSHGKVVDTLGSEACVVITELELSGVLRSLPGGVLVVRT
jgi:DNA protecting protein DprA